MYARKYDEEFEEYLPLFVTDIWTLLTSTGNDMKYDGVSDHVCFSFFRIDKSLLFYILACEQRDPVFSSGCWKRSE